MRRNGFVRSIGFAALAAGGSVVWLLVAAPVVGGRPALAVALVGLAALYLGGLAATLRQRLATLALAGGVGLGLAALAPSLRELAFGLAVLVGVSRSGFLFRTAPARAVVTEATLGLGGLAFAHALGDPSLRGVAFGVWGYFLVQSLFFLVPGRRARRAATARDPFDVACERATALLERRM